MLGSSKKRRVVPTVTMEEQQRRLQEEIINLRGTMRHLLIDRVPPFAVIIECKERRLASLQRQAPKVGAHPMRQPT